MGLKPVREHATNNAQTYFVTSKTWEGRALFRAEPWARLFFQILLSYRDKDYLLHEFVLMPDHFHLLITPLGALEHAVQLIKGGFSYRVKKEFESNAEVWQRGFADHRIRDAADYEKHAHYIHLNPVKKRLCAAACEYTYSSAFPGWKLDRVPQGLKPAKSCAACGTAEAVPFQSTTVGRTDPRFARREDLRAEAVPFQSTTVGRTGPRFARREDLRAEAVPFQNTTVEIDPRTISEHDGVPAGTRTLQAGTRTFRNG